MKKRPKLFFILHILLWTGIGYLVSRNVTVASACGILIGFVGGALWIVRVE